MESPEHPTDVAVDWLEIDSRLRKAHALLLRRGVIERIANDRHDSEQWLACELASLVEGHFHRVLDVTGIGEEERRRWQQRVDESGQGFRNPRRDRYRRNYWLVVDGTRAGTMSIDTMHIGRSLLGISSLYVLPQYRGRGIAARALDAAYQAATDVGGDGVRLETSWCWQPAVNFYLRQGFWLRSWKHALRLVRSTQLCPYRVDVDDRNATFSVQLEEDWVPMLEAWHCGNSLGWAELPAFAALDESSSLEATDAAGTFALHLAVRGWPLVRSAETWEQRYRWCDMGMPEGLAFRIALFEIVAREQGFIVRTPRIPGLDYDAE